MRFVASTSVLSKKSSIQKLMSKNKKIDLKQRPLIIDINTMTSTSDLITKAKTFVPAKVTYKPPKVNTRGGKNIQCQLNKHPIVLQFPLMLTWGVNERVDENSGRVSYDMALQFGKGSSSVEKFQEALRQFQEKVLNDAVTKSKEWFGKAKLSREVAEAMMYPILKYPKKKDGSGEPDYERDPTLKLKVPYWDGKFNVELYDMSKKALYLPRVPGAVGPQGDKTPVDVIPKASHVKGLLACTGVWMAGGRFGVTWKLMQAGVRPPVRIVGAGQCHILDDSDDEDAVEQLKKHETTNDDNAEHADADEDHPAPSFGSSDDDDDDEEDAKPATPPAPKKKKKVVRRKKKKSGD